MLIPKPKNTNLMGSIMAAHYHQPLGFQEQSRGSDLFGKSRPGNNFVRIGEMLWVPFYQSR